MVSSKSFIGLAALVLLSAVSTSATTSMDPIQNCCQSYYDDWGLSLIVEVQVGCSGLISLMGSVINVVGLLLNTVGGLLKSLTIVIFLKTPTNKGEHIERCMHTCLVMISILNKCHPKLGDCMAQVIVALLTISVSCQGSIPPGLEIIVSILPGNKNTWFDLVKGQAIIDNCNALVASVGGMESLVGVKLAIYTCLGNLVALLSGQKVLIKDDLDVMLFELYFMISLCANLKSNTGLASIELLYGWHKQFNCGGDYTSAKQDCIKRCAPYGPGNFNDCFSS